MTNQFIRFRLLFRWDSKINRLTKRPDGYQRVEKNRLTVSRSGGFVFRLWSLTY